jgi:hypothetical protein
MNVTGNKWTSIFSGLAAAVIVGLVSFGVLGGDQISAAQGLVNAVLTFLASIGIPAVKKITK